MTWIEKYRNELVNGKLTIEQLLELRRRDGLSTTLSTIKRHLNKAGFSYKHGKIFPKKKIEEKKKEKKEERKESKWIVCRDCKFNIKGVCVTPKQVRQGWTSKVERGECDYKEIIF